jgi:enoyl-CoA hydratase/carnithine racemase
MSELVTQERRGAVMLLTLNTPEKRNSLTQALIRALNAQFLPLENDRSVRAVVLTGGRHFCAGGPLDSLDTNPQRMRLDMRDGHQLVRGIIAGRLPVVAAVEGAAFGAGLSLAAACDFVVADASAKFGAVFGKVALVPDWGALWTLPPRIGLTRTKKMAMFCEVVGGEEATRIGLVDELAEPGQALATALALAERLAGAAPSTVSMTKTALARGPLGLDVLLDWEADSQALNIASRDFAEGRDAFFGKREPRFSGA